VAGDFDGVREGDEVGSGDWEGDISDQISGTKNWTHSKEEKSMKTIILTAVLLLGARVGPAISQAERDKAVAELESSEKAFVDATHGLSEAQWNFKPAPFPEALRKQLISKSH
jgi:hypothetical protein